MFLRLLGVLLLGCAGVAVGATLPPVPDSLRAATQAARTDAARLAVYLRVAAAYAAATDEADTRAYARAAQALARSRADSLAVGRALSVYAFVLLQQGNDGAAAPLLRRAAPLLATAPLRWQADTHAWLAWLLGDTNQPAQALRYLRRAYAEYGRLHDAGAQAELSGTATVVYTYQGHPDSAALLLQQAARVQHRLHQPAAEASTLGNLASVLHQLDRLPEAERYARQAIATLQQLGDEASQVPVYQTLGNILWAQHRPAPAAHYYREAIRLGHRHGLEDALVATYGSLAGTFRDLHQPDSALAYHLRAIRLGQTSGQTTGLGIEMGALADLYAGQHRWPEAERWARASLVTQRQQQQQLQLDRPLEVLELAAENRADYRAALGWSRQLRQYAARRAALQSQEVLQKERARFDTERAEQQVALLTSRARVQAQQQEVTRLRTQRTQLLLAGLAALVLALAGAALWQVRRRQQQREVALRQQIAADLHDDVGSLLTQVSLQSDLLSQGVLSAEEQPELLRHVADVSRTAVRQMSDAVWGLHQLDHHATLAELLARLRDHAHAVLPPAGLELEFSATPGLPERALSAVAQQALYLIYKEALHNAVKYAQGATTVAVGLQVQGQALVMDISDDGQPLAAPVAVRPGHGLHNMQSRAQAVGGTASGEATPTGFQVRVRLPLR